jgi:hypothetical protein
MKADTIRIRVTHEIETSMIMGEIANALDHGIAYWAASADPETWPPGAEWTHEVPMMGGTIVIVTHGGDRFRLNQSAIKRGIRIMARDYPFRFKDLITQGGDCDTSDALIQCAIFGEIVYC